jgi:hypothetical protein
MRNSLERMRNEICVERNFPAAKPLPPLVDNLWVTSARHIANTFSALSCLAAKIQGCCGDLLT